MQAVPRADGPLRSHFPGELVLRDLPERASLGLAQLVTARLVVLQLAERYAQLEVEDRPAQSEFALAAAYLPAIAMRAPSDELYLRRSLQRMEADEPRRVVSALLSCGDCCLNHQHRLGAYGFYLAAFELAGRTNQDAASLSLSTRLSQLAATVQRIKTSEQWERRQMKLLQRCQ